MYYHFSEPVKKLAGHRVLAINRGEKEKILSVKLIAPEEQIVRYMEKQLIIRPDGDAARMMEEVILDSYRRLIGPAIEREIRDGADRNGRERRDSVYLARTWNSS